MIKRAQNYISESSFLLPACSVYAIVLCMANGLTNGSYWVQFGSLVAATYLIVELNNGNALLRVPSRMVSCSFLVLTMMVCCALTDMGTALSQLSLVAFFLIIFKAYQDKSAPGNVFFAFLPIGTAALIQPQILFVVPMLWIGLMFFIIAMSVRNFMASVLGLVTPVWLTAGITLYIKDLEFFPRLMEKLVAFMPFSAALTEVSLHSVIVYLWLILIFLIGTIHFLRTSYKDKIKTRLFYEFFINLNIFILILCAIQPQYALVWLPLSIVCTAPLIAHFNALTNTRVTNITFFVILIGSVVLAFVPLVLPSVKLPVASFLPEIQIVVQS